MEIKKSWKLIFILYITHPLLGCDVRWFGSDCQDNYRCSNESWHKRNSVVSHCEDDRKLDARALSCFPHDVIRTENEESLNMSQTNFTKKLNTCPVKESVELMCFGNITNHSTVNDTIKPDLGYTFQLDQSGKVINMCFSFPIKEINGEKTDNAQLIVTITESDDSQLELTLTSDTDEMSIYVKSWIIFENPPFYNFTGVTPAGSFEKFRVGQKDAQVFTLNLCHESGKCVKMNYNVPITIGLQVITLKEVSMAVAGITVFIALVYLWNIWRRRQALNQWNQHNQMIANLQQQIAAINAAIHGLAAPAG